MTTKKFNQTLVAITFFMLVSMILPWASQVVAGNLTLVDILFIINEPNAPGFNATQWFNLIACSVLPALGLSTFCITALFTNNNPPPRAYALMSGLTPFIFIGIAVSYLRVEETGVMSAFSALNGFGVVRLGVGVYLYLLSAISLLALTAAYFFVGNAFLRHEASPQKDEDAYIYT